MSTKLDLDFLNSSKISKSFINNKGPKISSFNLNDYSFDFSKNLDILEITYDSNFTNYAIILKHKMVNSALIGFNLNDNSVIDCKQIQGGKNKFKQLTPILWDLSLMNKLIEFGNSNSFEKILFPFPSLIESDASWQIQNRISQRYEACANYFKFKRDDELNKFVKYI